MLDGEVMNILTQIPSSMEYETDARDIWPKRWQLILQLLAKCNGALIAHGYGKNDPLRMEIEAQLPPAGGKAGGL